MSCRDETVIGFIVLFVYVRVFRAELLNSDYSEKFQKLLENFLHLIC